LGNTAKSSVSVHFVTSCSSLERVHGKYFLPHPEILIRANTGIAMCGTWELRVTNHVGRKITTNKKGDADKIGIAPLHQE
jgi:hypothetical protein